MDTAVSLLGVRPENIGPRMLLDPLRRVDAPIFLQEARADEEDIADFDITALALGPDIDTLKFPYLH